jgi:hypothetical protein
VRSGVGSGCLRVIEGRRRVRGAEDTRRLRQNQDGWADMKGSH